MGCSNESTEPNIPNEAELLKIKKAKQKKIVENEPEETPITENITLPQNTLKKFDISSDATVLNEFLFSLGYDLPISNEFNELTVWALTDLQLQFTPNNVTGVYDVSTKELLNGIQKKNSSVDVGSRLVRPSNPDNHSDIIENPYDISAIVNKSYSLPSDYVPIDLTVPHVRFPFSEDDPKKQLRQVAATALEDLFNASDNAGLELFAQSGYRSFDRQVVLFDNYAKEHGEEKANTYSAKPGQSEHQTGLVMDVTTQSINFEINLNFEETKESAWLKDNAHEYGFIIRYPKGKEAITLYQYEPWHLRYVGVELATELHNESLTLEEYYLQN